MDHVTDVFKVLSDETRLRIIILLAQGELCVCQLSGILAIAQPKISKHLAKLRDMGFVSIRRSDKFIYYRLEETNAILNCIAKDILANIDQYPRLIADQHRIDEKETFLKQCRTPCL